EFYEHCLRTGQSTVTLVDEVRHNLGKMWPTPTASETTAREGIKITQTGRRKTKNGGSHSLDLATTVKLWPTPAAQDAKNATMPPSQINRDTVPGAVMRSL